MRKCKPSSVISWPVACGLQCLPCICMVVCCQDHLVPYPSPILSSFLSLFHLMLCHACCLSHCHTSSCPSLCVTPLAHTAFPLLSFINLYQMLQHISNLVLHDLQRSEEHTSELQSLTNLVCRLLLDIQK